jgi:hypothetical protein
MINDTPDNWQVLEIRVVFIDRVSCGLFVSFVNFVVSSQFLFFSIFFEIIRVLFVFAAFTSILFLMIAIDFLLIIFEWPVVIDMIKTV